MNAKLFIGLACLSLGLTACKDDYFDQEAYDARIMKAFPVKNVDPTHTWATYGSATAYITVNGDYGKSYRIEVTKQNPLYSQSVNLLAIDSVATGSTSMLPFSFELAQPTVYFTLYDDLNRRVVKAVNASDGDFIDLNFFGEDNSGSRRTRATEAESPAYARTVTDYLNPTSMAESWQSVESFTLAELRALPTIDDESIKAHSGNLETEIPVNGTATYAVPENYNPAPGTTVNLTNGSTVVGTITFGEGGATKTGEVFTDNFNYNQVSNSQNFFTHSEKFNLNNKFKDGKYNNETYQTGLKMEAATSISFTTTKTSIVTIIQSDWQDSNTAHGTPKTIKFDGTELQVSSASVVDGCYIYTLKNVAIGAHSITRGSGESGLYMVKVEYVNVGASPSEADASYGWLGYSNKLSRSYVTFKPFVSGTLNFTYYGKWEDDYRTYIEDNGSWVYLWDKYWNGVYSSGGTLQFNVEAGHTYKFYLHNALLPFYGLNMTYSGKAKLGDGFHMRVAAGTTITETFHFHGDGTSDTFNGTLLFVQGTVHLKGDTFNGTTVVVDNGGKLILDSNTSMSKAGRIIILEGGELTSKSEDDTDVLLDCTNGAPCYNAGTVNLAGHWNINGCDFYNCGTVTVGKLTNTTSGGKITNFGSITAGANWNAADTYNCEVINGCYMHYTGDAGVGQLTMLPNSRLDVDGMAEFAPSWGSARPSNAGDPYTLEDFVPDHPNILMDKALVNVESMWCVNTVFQGPSASGEFAVVKMDKAYVGNCTDLMQKQNCYFDWDITNLWNEHDGEKIIDTNNDKVNNPWGYWVDYYRVHITKFVKESEAPAQLSIPASTSTSDCAGAGYNGDPTTPVADDVKRTPESYRFCFEDMFPSPGDYDFNDCVMTVTPEVEGTVATVTITLDAVGANKQVAAALRIDGMHNYYISSATYDGPTDHAASYASYKLIPDTETPAGWTDISTVSNLGGTWNGSSSRVGFYTLASDATVISLFNDAHWMLSRNGSNNVPVYYFYNTVDPNMNHAMARQTSPVKMVYTFNCTTENYAKLFGDIKNYDMFIVERYDGRIWEVHTTPWKFDQVLGAYFDEGTKLSRYIQGEAANYPWAIQVPGTFRYPIEWQSICGDGLSTTDNDLGNTYGSSTSAYSVFAQWAMYPNQSAYQQWYATPDEEDRVYPLLQAE